MAQLAIIWRQVRRSSQQAVLFVLCVALCLTAMTAFSGFALSVDRSLRKDARKLQGADIIIKSYDPISAPLGQAIDRLVDARQVQRVNMHEFFSVVRAQNESASLLAALKVVAPGYPFFGEVTLASGRPFGRVLSPGRCIVEQNLLDRLGLHPGDHLKVGHTVLTIADVVTAEPDRPVNFFSFGPRVFADARDLSAMGVVAEGSRIRRVVLIKVRDPGRLEAVAGQLKQAALADQEQVDTYLTAGSRVTRFLNNFFFFLKLVGLFILLLAGLGIQGTLGAMLNEKRDTIAIMKTVGATNPYMVRHFAGIITLLGIAGIGLGIFCGLFLQHLLAIMMAPYLPPGLEQTVAWDGVLEAVALGCGVLVLFSFLPLYRVSQMRPVMILRSQTDAPAGRMPWFVSSGLILIFFIGLVLWHMQDIRFGFQFALGVLVLILAAALPAQLMLVVLKRRRNSPLAA